MPDALKPYIDLAHDAGLALTDAGYAYGLLVAAAPLLTLAGLFVFVGLIATHGKSHGTRFSAMAVFIFAAIAGVSAWLLRPDAANGTMLGTLLTWSWLPPLLAALSMFVTMPKDPKARALGLAGAMFIALSATLFGGMLAVANQKAMHPDDMAWLDAPPLAPTQPEQAEEQQAQTLQVLDTARHR